MFVNREREAERLRVAFQREKPQLIVVYGRRRCGKSTLLHHVLPADAIYFSADLRESPLQISTLATEIDHAFPGFAKPVYPDWESLFISFNTILKSRITLCIDEFPYLVKNNPDLPSVIQKLVDRLKERNFHLVLCGSSQQMMHSMVLDSASPMYGRCDEILRVRPMTIGDMKNYLSLSSVEAVREFGVWGGIPRYWEIRSQATIFSEAIKKSILDQNGILNEEPERLFSDELRTASQTFSILSLIGSGAHRASEIAGRLGKPVTQLSRQFGFLINQGYIRREMPFGESVKSSKRSLYKLDDPFLNFYFTFLVPNKSRLESELIEEVWQEIEKKYDMYISAQWEEICRKAIPFLRIAGEKFNPAARWWGNGIDKKPLEIDIVAESTDKRMLLIGEVKWSDHTSIIGLAAELDRKIQVLPFVVDRSVLKVLFLKEKPEEYPSDFHIIIPDDIVENSYR